MPLLMCPNDNAAMQTLERGGVQFDMCPACRGVWLDRGELEKLMASATEEGRASAPAAHPAPAAAFAFDVVRRPAADIATVLGGGWIASGPALASRQPRPVWPANLRTLPREAAGEVQTPLTGARAARRAGHALEVGSRVWMRHAKSGEPAERVNELVLVDEEGRCETVPTYRGEGKAFL